MSPMTTITVVSLGGVGLALAVLLFGLHLGDRPGDAHARVRPSWEPGPDGGMPAATIRVDNAGAETVVVTADTKRVSSLTLAVCQPANVRVLRRARQPRTPAGTLLGVVEPRTSRSWSVPIGGKGMAAKTAGPARATKVVVHLYQGDGRTRLFSCLLPVSGRPPVGTVSGRGDGGGQPGPAPGQAELSG
ncbi:MAG: hypothetical protein ACRD0J_03070 [Acidimicrobiales bacterium]